MSKFLMATQKDCVELASSNIAYEENRLATSDFAESAGCEKVFDDGDRIVDRMDLQVAKFIAPLEGLSMRIECGMMQQTVAGVDWQYIGLSLKNPEVQGDTQRLTNSGQSNDLVLTKVSGGDVGDVSIWSSPGMFVHCIIVTTPDIVTDDVKARYNLSNSAGKSLADFEIALYTTIEEFPITLYIDTTNYTDVVGNSVVLGGMYAGTEYVLTPNSTEENEITISSKYLWYKSGGEMGQEISFLLYNTNGSSLHWEIDNPDVYSYLDPDPNGQSTHVASRLKFLNKQAADDMYEEYIRDGEVSIWMQVFLTE